jgi:nucleolar protein 15
MPRVKKAVEQSGGKGVIYVGHIPFGFFENQMESFFSQFGEVLRLRLSRNRKTGKSKHYAFVEFNNPEVAQIVADTMNGYMMFERTIVCHYVEPDKVPQDLFKGAGKKFHVIPFKRLARENQNKEKTAASHRKRTRRLVGGDKKRTAKLAALGIDYEFHGYKASRLAEPKQPRVCKAEVEAVEVVEAPEEVKEAKAVKGKAKGEKVEKGEKVPKAAKTETTKGKSKGKVAVKAEAAPAEAKVETAKTPKAKATKAKVETPKVEAVKEAKTPKAKAAAPKSAKKSTKKEKK